MLSPVWADTLIASVADAKAQLAKHGDGEYDDIEPCYLPDGGIVFVSGRGKRFVNCWLTQVAILYRCDGDGRNITQSVR